MDGNYKSYLRGVLTFGVMDSDSCDREFLIGLERDMKGKPTGLRTKILVTMVAALFVVVLVHFRMPDIEFMRVIGQMVVGVGLLEAGVIMKRKEHVKGLTMAATIWCSAGFGCLSASSMFA